MAILQGSNTTRVIMQFMAACVFVVLLLGMGKPVSGREIYVEILNDLPGEVLQTHCHSADNDLQIHEVPYLSDYQFNFGENILGTTLFTCDFTSPNHPTGASIIAFQGFHYSTMPCVQYCNWSVNPLGFYLNGQFVKAWPSATNMKNVSKLFCIFFPFCVIHANLYVSFVICEYQGHQVGISVVVRMRMLFLVRLWNDAVPVLRMHVL
ncbi:unnamed protein product [Sphagnum troendelagicum]|uniref:S-protein homolog n=1 Tax=Sphagnum troendelagicum TaxID=128251 RepID=A0ABP0U452_9BRYO